MEAPGRVELPTNGLGNRCSIHLSYGANLAETRMFTGHAAPVALWLWLQPQPFCGFFVAC